MRRFSVGASTWQVDIHFHTLTEVVASLASLTIGVMSMARFYVSRSSVFLFIGAGFLGTSLLDDYHALHLFFYHRLFRLCASLLGSLELDRSQTAAIGVYFLKLGGLEQGTKVW